MVHTLSGIDEIVCSGIGKRYLFEWVIKGFDYHFHRGQCYGITGPNGSGKSTLLKMLSGHASPTAGSISFKNNENVIPITEVFGHITYAAPYIELIEVMTVRELLYFHHGLRPLINLSETEEEIKGLPFRNMLDKKIEELSSGMKQRIKLILTLMTRTSVVLLDEPGTNLDEAGKRWFEDLLSAHMQDRIVIIASNEKDDLRLASRTLSTTDFKPVGKK